jgi:uncharacterized protein YciI
VSPRFVSFYPMRDEPDRGRAAVPRHVSHWRGLGLPGYLGGPFADRTGGLIVFETEDTSRAAAAVNSDPFVQDRLLEAYWLEQWIPQYDHQRFPGALPCPRASAWPAV